MGVTRTPSQPTGAQRKCHFLKLDLWYTFTSPLGLEATVKPLARYLSRLSLFRQPGSHFGSQAFSILHNGADLSWFVVFLPGNSETVVCFHWNCVISYFFRKSKERQKPLGMSISIYSSTPSCICIAPQSFLICNHGSRNGRECIWPGLCQ